MSHFSCHMSHVECLCWSLERAKQLLFSCLCSKVMDYKWNWQWVFSDIISITLPCYFRVHRAGTQLKTCFSKKSGYGSGGRTICPERLSISLFHRNRATAKLKVARPAAYLKLARSAAYLKLARSRSRPHSRSAAYLKIARIAWQPTVHVTFYLLSPDYLHSLWF